jgi:hypothetical protein
MLWRGSIARATRFYQARVGYSGYSGWPPAARPVNYALVTKWAYHGWGAQLIGAVMYDVSC